MTANLHADRILILDFGSQYTQLIARRVREAGVYCEILPYDIPDAEVRAFTPKGIILSGGPESVTAEDTPRAPQAVFDLGVPVPITTSADYRSGCGSRWLSHCANYSRTRYEKSAWNWVYPTIWSIAIPSPVRAWGCVFSER
ncbi:hypothetical protein CCP3SC15_6460001 [Gammaproteobacteria bacterium]